MFDRVPVTEEGNRRRNGGWAGVGGGGHVSAEGQQFKSLKCYINGGRTKSPLVSISHNLREESQSG